MSSKHVPADPASTRFLEGGGETGALMRSMDWSKSGLGRLEGWPQSLRSAVSICIGSRFPIVLYWGPQCTVLYNDAYAEILGKKHPWALGRPCQEVWSEIWDVIAPMLDGVVATGQATWSEDQLLFLERRGYPEECYFSFSFSPVRGEAGEVEGIFTAVIENTRRVLGDRRLRTLRELAAHAVAAKDEEHAWQMALDGLAEAPEDLPFALLYRADPNAEVAQLVGARGLDNPPATLGIGVGVSFPGAEVLLISRPGSAPYGYFVAGLSRHRTLDDEYRGFLTLAAEHIATGIANARAYEEETKRAEALAELDRAKTAFFSNVSHEFRTPLTLMLGPLDDVLAAEVAPDHRTLLAVAKRSGQRLQKLVNTLLDFARIEAGRTQASFEPTDLAALTTDLASNFRAACESAGLKLVVDCPPLHEPAFVDCEMWEKIVLNLLSNAFKFTLEGEIEVALQKHGDAIVLTVRDTGAGIPADELPRMFERFHRVAGTQGRSHEGTGIGLALVQELVKLHGGTIGVESTLGAGTTFTVSIPRGSAHLPPERVKGSMRTATSTAVGAEAFVAEALRWIPDSETPEPESPAAEKTGERILLADDNADLRDYVQRLLGDRYEVEAVADGQAALSAARARRPDLVVSDVMMPQLDGFGLIRALRADPALATVPVLLLSARAGEESRIEGLAQGADDYLVKPFAARELLVRVGTMLQSARIREHAFKAVAEGEERLAIALDTGTMGAWELDIATRDVKATPGCKADFGLGPDETLSYERAFELIHPDDRERVEVTIQSAIKDHRDYDAEYRVIWPDGSTHWIVARGRPFFDEKGQPTRMIGVTVDVTERKRAEQALKEADQRKDEFLATLSHELRNPLAPLRNAVPLLRLAEADGKEAASIHDMVERQVNHLVRLVDDLLEVSRISRGAMELRRERIDVGSFVRNAVETSDPLIKAQGHTLAISVPDDPVMVDGDPVRLSQIIANLLNNAAKYHTGPGRIEVEVRREGGDGVISVRDNGIGIEAEMLPRLFEMFSRGESTGRFSKDGLGIGLALARQLARLHGGDITARSGGAGKGSEFIVRLPVASAPAPQAAGDVARKTIAPLGATRVLVVDDNRDAADSLSIVLEMLGAQVEVAHDGPAALEALDRFHPGVVLLDIGMPGMDGYEVARRMRSHPAGAATAIVALTGWGQEQDRARSRAAGFDHHLVKPADIDALHALMASIQAQPPGNRLQ